MIVPRTARKWRFPGGPPSRLGCRAPRSVRMAKKDRSTEPELIRAFRRHTGMTQQRLGELLGATGAVVSAYERDGAPAWMRYALFGVAVEEIGMRAEAAAALVGIAPGRPLLDRVPAPRRSPADASVPEHDAPDEGSSS